VKVRENERERQEKERDFSEMNNTSFKKYRNALFLKHFFLSTA
jgi:hypothetical protein